MNPTPPNEKRYPVQERFMAFQGEGVHAGRSAFFIRLYGCPVKCPWCDSAGTWHHDYKPDSMEAIRMTVADLLKEAKEGRPEFVVITGGEPCVHDLLPLVAALRTAGLAVHLETCGAFDIIECFSWVTVSPKHNALPLPESVARADEFKLIIESKAGLEYWARYIEAKGARARAVVWLHPEWSRRADHEVLRAVGNAATHGLDAVKHRRYRAGWQLHKLYDVDALDGRTKPKVPLGGDPSKGL